ncbi:DUF1579 family protein [Reichenbachiella sp.]|uniref:DUF1579 family protein n=1 Tax=Reichenbachiella sp. TaxID=2184521 RepID=UPI003BB142C5
MQKLLCLLLIASLNSYAQQTGFPCQHTGNARLGELIGTWKVEAKDRISPGNYEMNAGVSVISTGLNGCSIQESYKGVYRENYYAVEVVTYMRDSMQLQRVYYDSEHSNVMVLEGFIEEKGFTLNWTRDPNKKKMQVKFQLDFKTTDTFEWTTHLSTDFGKTWQLTHQWKYNRVTPFVPINEEHSRLKEIISNYHQGLSQNKPKLVLSALGDQFIMWNGNYSPNPINWQAHMSLSGEDLKEWPAWMIQQAGPYANTFDILSVNVRANSAVVVTLDTGQNKFRKWKEEQTTWLLGKKDDDWKILGYYLQDISNP